MSKYDDHYDAGYEAYIDGTHRDIADLQAENAKLRELVAELYQCSRQCGCDTCGYKDDCTMIDRMAELGIEVEA